MGFMDSIKQYTKQIDSDALSAQISKGSAAAAKLGASAGIINHNTAAKMDKAAQMGAKQLDAYGDKNPEMFKEKAQAANPHAPVGEHGAQPDHSAPHMSAPPAPQQPGQPPDAPHAGGSYQPGAGVPPQFNSAPPPQPGNTASTF